MSDTKHSIKAVIGLGNPDPKHYFQRHNIGFRIIDAFVQTYGNGTALWKNKPAMEICQIVIAEKELTLIKPMTFMNSSGQVIPHLLKTGIQSTEILVIHDELEKPFGNISIKIGGSHKGHNGLKSIIQYCGPEFARLRFGIGRPGKKEDVPEYVLRPFSEPAEQVNQCIEQAIEALQNYLKEL
ncbi:aminoacyl-tRNA hydrolase [bacterium]|nr:MAG: aminoacyl-tRNA hydrolase [bacterium]QQR62256.1 MAG: aminoacyl-tRNA hydrolase [bacterium]QQR63180.1 MAG: aminoacyl-tRNA hydrolase [bacterium]